MGKESKLGLKRKRRGKGSQVDANNEDQIHADAHADNKMTHLEEIHHANLGPKHKVLKKEKKVKPNMKKKRRREKGNEVDASNNEHAVDEIDCEGLDREDKKMGKESKSGSKKKRRREKGSQVDLNNEDQIHADEHADNEMTHFHSRHKKNYAKRSTFSQTLGEDGNPEKPMGTNNRTKIKAKKVNKEMKHKKKNSDIVNEPKSEETLDEEEVEEILSVDEDCSQGMKKWLIKYEESRPGLKILQERIDDFITAYEEQQEQEKKEREALAAEGGWTVVAHQKGRKKTTDTESGVTVGSVAQAAVVDKMGKKKSKEAPLDFYRFQKREAKRNEVMMLQSKFEQDKKRIQQLRAARKFRPY